MTEARPERVVTAAALRLSRLVASPDALSDQDAGVVARGVVVHLVEKPGRTAARVGCQLGQVVDSLVDRVRAAEYAVRVHHQEVAAVRRAVACPNLAAGSTPSITPSGLGSRRTPLE